MRHAFAPRRLAWLLLFIVIALPGTARPDAIRPDAADRPPRLMLANTYAPGIDITEYWVSEKLDGVRARWDGSQLLSRGGARIHAPAWFTRDWPDAPLDGELWLGRARFDTLSGIVRTLQPDDDAWRQVRFMVFDLPRHPGPFSARLQALRALLDTTGVPWLEPIAQFRVATEAELAQRLAAIVTAGGEGLMLHHQDARYLAGRSAQLLKLKPYHDAEAQVVGYTPGQGKYQDLLGALIVARPDGVRFRVGSGFTDAERAAPPPLGSWITYRYNGLTANGLPRFARFVRVRDALPPPDPE